MTSRDGPHRQAEDREHHALDLPAYDWYSHRVRAYAEVVALDKSIIPRRPPRINLPTASSNSNSTQLH